MAYTEEDKERIFNDIITEMADKGTPARTILLRKGMPSSSTFFAWLEDDSSKSKRYARACEFRADALFDELLDIVYNTEEGVTIKETDKGNEITRGDMLGHRKLKADTLKWAISKLSPKKYGDKIDLTTDGEKLSGSIPLVLEDGRSLNEVMKELKPDEED